MKEPRPGRPIGRRVAVAYCKHYEVNLLGLERLHAFDVHKYEKIYLRLCRQGILEPAEVFVPEPVTVEQIRLVHSETFLRRTRDPAAVARWFEAPALATVPAGLVDAGLLAPLRRASGGTLCAAREALHCGVGINLGGGYHHAEVDRGGGFNAYNDLAIAIRALQREGCIDRALVVDLDVHQGDGTAEIFAGDDRVFTFSIHQPNIYPVPKAVSDVDVKVPARTGDAEYLRLLRDRLPDVLDRATPDIVLYQAGCDVLADDPLAGVSLTPDGVVQRDEDVMRQCADRGVPVVMTLGGGYSRDAWTVQYRSVRNLLETFGGRSAEAGPDKKQRQ